MEYILALIEACGGILGAVLGALIAGGYISRTFKGNVLPLFRTYADKKHDAHKMMRKAQKNIYIVASIGDQLLEKHEKQIQAYLNKGIELRFLIHNADLHYELEKYIGVHNDFDREYYTQIRSRTIEKLLKLKQDFPNLVKIQEFNLFYTASYIAIDIEEDIITHKWPAHSMIQVMLYQYGIVAEECPITYFSPKVNQKLFENTAQCILNMWDAGHEIQVNSSKKE